jgi:hypothetical protein
MYQSILIVISRRRGTHVGKQADPEHELMQLRMARAWSRPQTVGSGSVPFWALSSCEAKEWVRHQAADYPSNECVRLGPWSARKQVTAELHKEEKKEHTAEFSRVTRWYAKNVPGPGPVLSDTLERLSSDEPRTTRSHNQSGI